MNNKLKFTGTVHRVIEKDGQYPTKSLIIKWKGYQDREEAMLIEFGGKNLEKANGVGVGHNVEVEAVVSGRTYANKTTGDLECFVGVRGLELAFQQSASAPQQPSPSESVSDPSGTGDDSDLPF